MNPSKRRCYKVYHADKSMPVPKVSLWRWSKQEDTLASDNIDGDLPMSENEPALMIDAFHRQAFETVSLSKGNYNTLFIHRCYKTNELARVFFSVHMIFYQGLYSYMASLRRICISL